MTTSSTTLSITTTPLIPRSLDRTLSNLVGTGEDVWYLQFWILYGLRFGTVPIFFMPFEPERPTPL